MYFLSSEESKWLLKHLLPRVREAGVVEELRGWNWHQPPLDPPYGVRPALYEIAGKYCPNGRDMFLRRVAGIEARPGVNLTRGVVYHSAIVQVVQEAKRLIYMLGPRNIEAIRKGLDGFRPVFDSVPGWPGDGSMALGVEKIRSFEASRICARVQDALSRQPFIGSDSLAATVLPVTCEHRLDGSLLGLSSLLSCDAASFGGTVVFDLKFGKKRDFHRLSTAGYALVMESLWDFPVDIGCTAYVDLRGAVPAVTRDIYAIDDELRQWFIDERDDKMRMVSEELDPGVAEDCYEYCAYRAHCHPEHVPAGRAEGVSR